MKTIIFSVLQILAFAFVLMKTVNIDKTKAAIVSALSFVLSGVALYVLIYHILPLDFFRVTAGLSGIIISRFVGALIYFAMLWMFLRLLYKISLKPKQILRLCLLTIALCLAFEWLNTYPV